MGYMDEDDPDYWNDRRRAKDDMQEAMRDERRYDRSSGGDDEDVLEFFLIRGIVLLFIVFVLVGAMYFAAGWLDAHLGWGLVAWMNSWLPPFLQRK